jgi:hypothetical protein
VALPLRVSAATPRSRRNRIVPTTHL